MLTETIHELQSEKPEHPLTCVEISSELICSNENDSFAY